MEAQAHQANMSPKSVSCHPLSQGRSQGACLRPIARKKIPIL
jgi:hypothetical protein